MRRVKTLFLSMLAISFMFLMAVPSVYADRPSIEISIQEGFDGKVKLERGYPIQITLKNKGSDFSGDMLVGFSTDYNLGGNKAVHVELPKNSEKTYEVNMPGISANDTNFQKELVTIYEGSWKTGNKVKISGKNKVTHRILDTVDTTVGLLSENPDRMKELQIVKINGKQSTVIHLDKNNIPDSGISLQFFDFLVIDDYPITELSDQQQTAIVDWIRQGGMLIAGGTSKGNHAWGKMEEYMPMRLDDKQMITDLKFITQPNKQKPSFSKLSIFTGDLDPNAKVHEKSGDLPVLINRSLDQGMIWQTAFSLGEEPLSVWSGYSDYLQSLLSTIQVGQTQIDPYYNSYSFIYNEIGSTNELFPAANVSMGFIILMIVGYVFIITIVLYVILRKIDKREHSWWVIPVIAILFSVGIFGIGAKDRVKKPQLAEMGMLQADEQGTVQGAYAATIFSNRGGDYQLSVPKNQFNGVTVTNQDQFIDSSSSNQNIILETKGDTVYAFPKVEYWSTRSVIGHAHKEDVGNFDIDLTIEGNQLKGTITNQFPFDFSELFIWSGTHIYNLGELKSEGQMKVNEKLKETFLAAPLDYGIDPYRENLSLEEKKKEHLIGSLAYSYMDLNENSPIVFGYTDAKLINTNIENKQEVTNRTHLIYQLFKPKGKVTGKFTITSNQLSIHVIPISGQIIQPLDTYHQIGLENGEYEAILNFPNVIDFNKAKIESIQFTTDGYVPIQLSFFDHTTKKFIKVDENDQAQVLKKNPDRFITQDGQMTIRLVLNGKEIDPFISFPAITVKGVVE